MRTRFDGKLESLAAIRELVRQAAAGVGLGSSEAYGVILAIDEFATNIVIHGYEENGLTGPIDIEVSSTPDHLVLTVEDDAVPFDPASHNLPDDEILSAPLEERVSGGLGILLMYSGVDQHEYAHLNGRNHNVFRVKLGPQPGVDGRLGA